MNIPTDVAGLSALFEKLGARDPQAWARSQLEEGIPQLHRFLFLRQAWRLVVSEGDAQTWAGRHVADAKRRPDGPFAGVGAAIERARAAGASVDDLAEIARGAQAELLFQLCYMLEDNGLEEPELEGVGWGLFQTDADGHPAEPIGGLHESVLETDPTGREMRPRTV